MNAKRTALTAASIMALASTAAHAGELPYGLDAYAGGFAGWGGSHMESSRDPTVTDRVYLNTKRDAFSVFFGGYAGIGWQFFAAEGGLLRLPGYHSSTDALFPTRSGVQDIGGRARFIRGVVRVPPSWGWPVQPFAFYGKMHVSGRSQEVDRCPSCGAGWNPTEPFIVHTETTRPYYGIGAEVPLYGVLSARAEIGHVPQAIQSFWTGTRNYTLGTVALQARF